MKRILPVAFLLSAAPTGQTYSDALPPQRYAKEGFATVAFLTPENVVKACKVKVPPGARLMACAGQVKGRRTIIMPIPYEYGKSEYYARLMAHELAHNQGWPATHGE